MAQTQNIFIALCYFGSCHNQYIPSLILGLFWTKLVLLILLHILQFVSVLVQKFHISSNLNFLPPTADEITLISEWKQTKDSYTQIDK